MSVEQLFARARGRLLSPLVVQLRVGLPPAADLLLHRDLDNYLEPLARRLRGDVCSWWATKQHRASSLLYVASAQAAAAEDTAGWEHARARTSASATSSAWKEEIESQVAADAEPASEGALELQITFAVGPTRNWVNLWKPAIDSLDPILGRTDPLRRFHPRDDRVVRLGLHRVVDSALGNAVELDLWWRPSPS